MIEIPQIHLVEILPAVVLCGAGLAALVVGLCAPTWRLGLSAAISFAGVLIALALTAVYAGPNGDVFGGLSAADGYSRFLNVVILVAVGLTILLSTKYLAEQEIYSYEYFVLLLFSAVGMMFMVSARHLLVLFLGLETLSICVYILTGLHPTNPRSGEAALKYLLLGAFSSGIFLYGAALFYGASGALTLTAMAKIIQSGQYGLLAKIGMGLMLVGFAFKAAAAPFHMWTPDVYEGAPSPLTGFMSVGVKAAAFAAFVRVFIEAFSGLEAHWGPILWVLAAVTMIVGNVTALAQDNIKRMLAYSSIAHAGYILVGVVAGVFSGGVAALLFYLLAYTFTNIGAFGVVALMGREGESRVSIDDYKGLAKTHPLLALTMAVFLFSLAGIPPTAGFVGKFAIFGAAISQGYVWLVVIGALTSAASVFYYFRVVLKMYMEEPERAPLPVRFGPAAIMGLVMAFAGVLYMGLFPAVSLSFAAQSVIKPLF
jgi:NADH-quinone oxidoreductase subunit N